MGVWDRLRARLGRPAPPGTKSTVPLHAAPGRKPDPEAEVRAIEARLEAALAARTRGGDAAVDVVVETRRLIDAGHELAAAAWLERHADATPPGEAQDALLLAAARLHADRGEDVRTARLLERLASSRVHGADAHARLAALRLRAGDLHAAHRHLEAALARDARAPGVRARLDAVLARLGERAPPPGGETIAGPGGARLGELTLLGELGRGATGVVYRARDEALGREVAVKLLHAHLPAAARARFFAEARLTAALRHPHIAAIFDLDEHALRLVMELCEGTLTDRVAAGPLAPALALRLHAELLDALAAAHLRGVVHRDVKLANALLRRGPEGPELVLGDFGAAHLAEAGAGTAPASPQAIGSLATMAPEQRQGQTTAASDVWAAGVVLWHTLTGRPPWDRQALLAGTRGPRDLALPALAGVGPDLHAELDAHLCSLGALTPEARPSAADGAARAIALAGRAGAQ